MSHKHVKYDVVIVGGGVSGTALIYTLSNYTNIGKIALIEKYGKLAQVNSLFTNNSQTLHFGDIETNYTLRKATKVKFAADMVRNYIEQQKLKNPEKKLFSMYKKMILAVGETEVAELEQRYKDFSKLFPNLRRIEREEIAELEPKVVQGRDPDTKMLALVSDDGYTMDFEALSNSFAEESRHANRADIYMGTKLKKISRKETYRILTNQIVFEAPVVVIAAGGHSLSIAHSLGYGKEYSILSIAGSFYLADNMLNGKVYTMQNKKLPFAAIHGDPDVHNQRETRFGPTAKAVLLLERHNYSTFWEYIMTFGIMISPFISLAKILSDRTVLTYILKNISYDIPLVGKRSFMKEARKVVPLLKASELRTAKRVGGARPQIINTKKKRLDMGEAKILGDNIIFNITPSPGASTCLGNAYKDTKTIMEFFQGKCNFNEEKFSSDFIQN